MTEHNLFYYPYASFTNAQLPLLKVAALYFDKLILLDPVGASWDTIGADHVARDAVSNSRLFLEIVTPAIVLAQYETPIAAASVATWSTASSSTSATRIASQAASSSGHSPWRRFRRM